MVETAGTKLRRARNLRQLSLEDASRATKIRVPQLADLEHDDYSNFANLAYARGFLVGYSKYLHVDVREYLEVFADTNTFALDDYQYLSEKPVGVYRAPTRHWGRQRRKHSRGGLLAAGGTALALAVMLCVSFLYVTYWRLGGDLGKLHQHQVANEQADRDEPTGSASKPAVGVPVPMKRMPDAPVVVPVSAPEIAPSNDDNRAASTALAVSEQSPGVLLSQLALPVVRTPVVFEPLDAGKPAASAVLPSPDGNGNSNEPRFVHVPDKNVVPYRQDVPKPRPVSNNSVD